MKRFSILAVAALALCGGAFLLISKSDEEAGAAGQGLLAEAGAGGRLPARSVEIVSESGPDFPGSTPVSPVYEVRAPTGRHGPFTLRFAIPDGAVLGRLAVATREREGDMWTLRAGQVRGGEFIVRTPTLSFWQLHELETRAKDFFGRANRAAREFSTGVSETLGISTRPVSCSGPIRDRVLTETDRDRLLLGPCIESVGDRTRMRVANQLGLALEFEVSEELEVEAVKGASLTEEIWDAINGRLTASSAAIVPGAGQLVLSFAEVPQEVSFRPTSSAFWVDAGLTAIARGGVGAARGATAQIADWAACVHATAEGIDERDPNRLNQVWASLWAECGQSLSGTPFALPGAALFDVFKLGRGTLDLRKLGTTASLRVDRKTAGTEARLEELAEQGASCGILRAPFLATGRTVAVVLGVVGGRVLCEEARLTVRRFITTNECLNAGNTCALQIDKFTCAAPTLGSYPRSVSCSAGDLRIVGIHTDAMRPLGATESCGTPARILPPGPYEVEANVPCEGARSLAVQLTNSPCIDRACELLPFRCETELIGYESARHRCRFGRAEIAFTTGA